MQREYEDYKRDPANNSAFLIKRMNRPKGETEYCVTDWENLVAATHEIDEDALRGHSCVGGIDLQRSMTLQQQESFLRKAKNDSGSTMCGYVRNQGICRASNIR